MRSIPAGATDVSIDVFLTDANGAALTGEAFGDVTLSYNFPRGARVGITAVTLAAIDSAHADGGFLERDATNKPGEYRLDLPDACFAPGNDAVTITVISAASEGYRETIAIDPSPANATGTVQAAASIAATTINLPAGLAIHEGSVGVVYAGTGVGSAFIVNTYATPSSTTLKAGLIAALGTDSEVIFFAAPSDTLVSALNDFDPTSQNVTVGTNDDKTDYVLSAAGVDAILDEVVEGSYTMRHYLRLFAAALLGKASGLGTTTAVFRDTADSKDRISATVDADGNRTAVTLTET